ncbi:unnamed protein product [Toxocara canis]|uniref:Uncharacterized protein n=1 Tax=Toxocara canis TaxID=6265 RepID=A0A183UGY2_TOXCA|nr:unnamed protein product [Toxocara canis]
MFLRRFWKEWDRERRQEAARSHSSATFGTGHAHPTGTPSRKVAILSDLTTTASKDDEQSTALNKEAGSIFRYLKDFFSKLSEKKDEAGVFVGRRIRKIALREQLARRL